MQGGVIFAEERRGAAKKEEAGDLEKNTERK